MGKAKRFNAYDGTVAEQRKIIEGFGRQRQSFSIGSSFRSSPLSPPTARPVAADDTATAEASFPLSYSVDDQGSKSGTVTHSLTATTAHKLQFTATADCDITITGFGSSNANAVDFYIEVTQDGTGGHAITVNDAEWIDFPTISTTADTTSLITAHADGDGNMRAVTLLNAAPTSGNFASKALDNLSSPVLNTSINFNSKAPTNFIGWTNLAGQTYIVSGTGVEHTLPTGDVYDYKVNGVSRWNVSEAGNAMTVSLNMNDNYMTMDDIAAPSNPGTGQRRLFVDTATGQMSVKTAGGSTVSLEAAGSTSFADDVFDVHDETTPTKILQFALENLFEGTHFITSTTTAARTWTLPDIAGELLSTQGTQTIAGAKTFSTITVFNGNVDLGNATSNTVTFTARVDSNLDPDGDGTRTLGTSSLHWDDVFTESLTLRGSGGTTNNTVPYVTADASTMIFNVPSTDEYLFKDNGITNIQFSEDSSSGDYFIRSGAAKKMGFITDSSNTAIGTSGTIKLPVDTGSVGSAAAANTDFGDDVGCIGLYLNTIGVGNPTLCWKVDDGTGVDNRWVALTISRTTGAVSGGVLT